MIISSAPKILVPGRPDEPLSELLSCVTVTTGESAVVVPSDWAVGFGTMVVNIVVCSTAEMIRESCRSKAASSIFIEAIRYIGYETRSQRDSCEAFLIEVNATRAELSELKLRINKKDRKNGTIEMKVVSLRDTRSTCAGKEKIQKERGSRRYGVLFLSYFLLINTAIIAG
jgi:hypothetical protein